MNNKTINYYNKYTKSFIQTTRSVDFTNIQNKFLSYLPSGAFILDFGCGSGRDTKYFLKRNYNVTAIDGSEEICKEASKYTGIKVKQMLFEELNDQNIYDGIWACASFLHLQEKEVLSFFEKINLYLNDNGIIYLSGKNGIPTGEATDGRYFLEFTEALKEKILVTNERMKLEELWYTEDVSGRKGFRWVNMIFMLSYKIL